MTVAARFGDPGAGEARRAPTWALAVLPALSVVLAYVCFPRARIEGLKAALRADLAGARASAPSAETESAETSQILSLRGRAAELRAKSAGASPVARADAGPVAHAARAGRIAGVLARRGIVLLEDVAAPEAGEEAALRLQGMHASEIRAAGAPARSLRFEGGYFEVLGALREIAAPPVDALPLLVELGRADDGRTLRWRLVWI